MCFRYGKPASAKVEGQTAMVHTLWQDHPPVPSQIMSISMWSGLVTHSLLSWTIEIHSAPML